jgi:dCTP deaminase
MILTDAEILAHMERGTIKIEPYDRSCLGSNSYDVHLGRMLGEYVDRELDAKRHNKIELYPIPDEGIVLVPEKFYLGVTEEYTETHAHVPFLEGKSSVGRLGIDIHATAGKGDIGFCKVLLGRLPDRGQLISNVHADGHAGHGGDSRVGADEGLCLFKRCD